MPPLEVRRLAVAAALDALSREPLPLRPGSPEPIEQTLEALTTQIAEVLKRLDSVETALLESVWEKELAAAPAADTYERPAGSGRPTLPPLTTAAADNDNDSTDESERLSVPALPLTDVRMSTRAAKALFGE